MTERPCLPGPAVDITDAQADAATRAILLRYEREGWTREETVQAMQMLGLVAYVVGGRTDSLGRRQVVTRAERRRKARAAERACAVETAASGETGVDRLNGAHRANQAQEETDSGHVPHHDERSA